MSNTILSHKLCENNIEDSYKNKLFRYDNEIYGFDDGEVFEPEQRFNEKVLIVREAYSLLKVTYSDSNGDFILSVFIKANDKHNSVHTPLVLLLSMTDIMDVLSINDTSIYQGINIFLNCKQPNTTKFQINNLLALYDNSCSTHGQRDISIMYIYYESLAPAQLDIGSFLGDITSNKTFTLILDGILLVDMDPSQKKTTDRIQDIGTDTVQNNQIIYNYFNLNII